uniref:Vps16 N-terminal domain-containing protein n=1 Tax=Lygus hesperus TaxID=30085 RepID=A0A0A9Y9Y6_LYGHE
MLPNDVMCVIEVDGVRLLSATKQFLLRPVPDHVQRVYKLNTHKRNAPTSIDVSDYTTLLVDAYENMMKGSSQVLKATHDLSRNKELLSNAINDCVFTASYVFSI